MAGQAAGRYRGWARWQLALNGGVAGLLSNLVSLGCGAALRVEGGVRGVMALGPMVDRDQVEAERGAVAEAVIAVADSGRLWRGAALSSEQRERA